MKLTSRNSLPIVLSVAVAISISGCAEKKNCQTPDLPKLKTMVKQPTQDAKDRQIAALQIAIAEARAKEGKTIVKEVVVPGKTSVYPPNAKPGECYARVLIPPKYKVVTEKVLAKEATQKVKIIPAKYKRVTKKVLVKEASEKIVTVPAKYKTVTEKVLVEEPSERLVTVPPVYETVTEKVLVKQAHTAWKKGRGPVEKLQGDTGEILCLVNVPAVYKTITKKVLKTPAVTKTIAIPPQYRNITKKVLLQPAKTKTVLIPAVYKTIQAKELVQPASVQTIDIPESYQSVQKKVKLTDAVLQWRQVVCKTNMSGNLVSNLQTALQSAGFNPGPIDGIYGWRTKAALAKFQKAKGLPAGALTRETLNALGL